MVFQRVCVCCACDPNERLSAPLSVPLLGFGIGTMLANFHM